jgi:hypothetical protein
VEVEQEEYVWELWSGVYPLMATGLVGFKSYDEFKRTLLKPHIKYSDKSSEEIMKEMLAVVEAYEKGR